MYCVVVCCVAVCRAMNDNKTLQQKMNADSEERLQKERLELQRLKIQLLARNESNGMMHDKSELYSIKREMLRLMESDPRPHSTHLTAKILNDCNLSSPLRPPPSSSL